MKRSKFSEEQVDSSSPVLRAYFFCSRALMLPWKTTPRAAHASRSMVRGFPMNMPGCAASAASRSSQNVDPA